MSKRARIRKEKPTLAQQWARNERITPELAAKIGKNAEERDVGGVKVMQLYPGPIEILARRGLLTKSLTAAATKLREDFERSGLSNLRAQDLTRPVVDQSGHKGEPLLNEMARSRFNAAIRCVSKVLYPTIRDVVLYDVPLSEAETFLIMTNERDRSIAGRSSLVHGLIEIAEHYRLPNDWEGTQK